jgi:hypothetical protein
MNATWLWPLWQAIPLSLAWGFTRRGEQRFAQWVTGLALNAEERTVTQPLIAPGRAPDRKALESFAEYGSWDLLLQWGTARRLSRLPNRAWHGHCVWAGDDTKVHRTSAGVWGTCTFHEHTALPQPRRRRPRPQPGRPGGVAARPGPARPLPPRRRAAVLPQDATPPAPEGAARPLPHQVRVAGGAGPRPRQGLLGQDVGRLRRRLRPAERGAPFGRAPRAGPAARGHPDPAAAGRPAAQAAAFGTQAGPERGDPEVGQATAASPARGTLAGGLAEGQRLHPWPPTRGGVQGGAVPVARAGPRRRRQGRGRTCGRLPQAVHPGDQRHRPERLADGGGLLCPVPAGGRLPRPEAEAGLGAVPGVHHPNAIAELRATVVIPYTSTARPYARRRPLRS